jgi:hypothetical protein
LGWALISILRRAYAAFRGFDDETGSVPMMDGPLRPNALLDVAPVALMLDDVDNVTPWQDGLLCSSGPEVVHLARTSGQLVITERRAFQAPVSCIASEPGGGLAVGLDGDGVLIVEGPHAGRTIAKAGGQPLLCPTAALFITPDDLIIANGAADRPAADWKRDLMERGASGSVWSVDLRRPNTEPELLASGLAFPNGLALATDKTLYISEAWLHRVVALRDRHPAPPNILLRDLPAYPGRITSAPDGGFWLSLFAPRNQLVEFVLRENAYRRRMIDNIDPAYWIAPALSSGASFLEPIQGGARKKLNMLKPWSPSWSYGLVARCNSSMRPFASLHSRADGAVHGVTSCCEADGLLYAAAKGSGRIVAIDPAWATGARSA